MAFLDGKEFERRFGEYGGVAVDLRPDLTLEVALLAQVDIRKELHKLAAKTGTKLDDMFLNTLDALLPKVPVAVAAAEPEVIPVAEAAIEEVEKA